MAKKKNDNTLQYLQMPLPEGRRYSKMTKVAFGGLNKRDTIDSGDLSVAMNISTNEYPCLTPAYTHVNVIKYSNPISMSAFDNFVVIVYREDSAIKIAYITEDEYGDVKDVYTGILKAEGATEEDENIPRSIVQFNVYQEGDTGTIIDGTFTKRLLIFPDKKSMYFNIAEDSETSEENKTFELYDMDDAENGIVTPPIKYATVHLSRVFGVSDDCVFASGFNDYTNWELDNVGDDEDDGYNEKNAWMSQTQSNTKADGKFTGIINYQGHIVCFKRDYMHEIYNNKNPFRIVDIYAEGTIDNRSIQDVDGKLIFVSDDNVKIYTGSNPRIIGHNLNMPKYTYAVSGTDNRNYYLYCEDGKGNKYLYVYDTYTELWSEQSVTSRILSFANNQNGMYMLHKSGHLRKVTDFSGGSWYFETDLITNKTVDIKHIKKLQMLVEATDETWMKVYILYDDEKFDELTSDERDNHLVYHSKKSGKFPIRVKPRKTANYGFKLRVEGMGYAKLYELEIFVESGGDLYV